MKKKRILIAFVLGAMLLSCSTSTKITGSWVDPAAKGTVVAGETIFLACLTSNIGVRTKLEDALAAQAALRGIKAVESSNYFSPDFYKTKPTEKELLTLIKGTGAQFILTVSLIKKESETRYVPGSGGYAPYPYYGWYGGFYSYYNYWYPMFYDPGYYVTDKIYFLESNLYDTASGNLLWSAQSQTVSPGSIDSFAKTYPKILIDQLVKDGVLAN